MLIFILFIVISLLVLVTIELNAWVLHESSTGGLVIPRLYELCGEFFLVTLFVIIMYSIMLVIMRITIIRK